MKEEYKVETEEPNVLLIKKLLTFIGAISALTGVVLQWPFVEKSYIEFIQGDGYLPLMIGLIMIVLGVSLKLMIGEEKE